MKKNNQGNSNGVEVYDSIVMSVKDKRPEIRRPLAVLIAVIGYVSVIMAFLGMFRLYYDETRLAVVCVILSSVYITLSLVGKKGLWVLLCTIAIYGYSAYRKFEQLELGVKYVYNVVYSATYNTNILYFKNLKPRHEEEAVTTLLIFGVWLLAIVIYFFTIYRPNPIFPILVSFPVLEIGLYNGIEISVFWGVMTVAYWLALLSMSGIDSGEYIGGISGFVRRNDLFFPKKHMKLKVTEECGLIVIALVLMITGASAAFISVTDYERSDEINQKRRDISTAFSEFRMDHFMQSMAGISSAFGFNISYDDHRLGSQSSVKYKNTTDLVCTFDKKLKNAVYLKDYTGAVYTGDQWTDLNWSKYSSSIFNDFSKYDIYPQDIPCIMSKLIAHDTPVVTLWIKSKLDDDRSFSPYGTENISSRTYFRDSTVSTMQDGSSEYSYKFVPFSAGTVYGLVSPEYTVELDAGAIADKKWKDNIIDFCDEYDLFTEYQLFTVESGINADPSYLFSNGKTVMALLIQQKYRDFVYANYMQVPSGNDMDEVREEYESVLSSGKNAVTAGEKLAVLDAIRNKMTSEVSYTLSPGKTPSNRDFVNFFLLENKKGYCTHYASAGVILARMAGIPARYATGYIIVGDDFESASENKDGTYTINVKDNRSHAWVEVYIDGYGWMPYEFTSGYSEQSIDPGSGQGPASTEPATTKPAPVTTTTTTAAHGTNTHTTRAQSLPQTSPVNTTTTAAAATTSNAPVVQVNGGISDDNTAPAIPAYLRDIIFFVLSLAAAAVIMLLRRKLILKKRERCFTSGSGSGRIAYMYDYAEKLLEADGISKGENTFRRFAELTEKNCGGRFFAPGEFSSFMDKALRSSFSGKEPDQAEIDECRGFVEALAQKVYDGSGRIKRLTLKYLLVLSR